VENSRAELLPYGLTNTQRSADAPVDNSLLSVTNGFRSTNTNRPSPTVTGILTDEQFRKLIAGMEKSGGADLLSAPAVTTMSGRQAQIKVVDIRYIVTDIDYSSTNGLPPGSPPEPMPIAEPFELGPVVDIVPHVEADGYTIQMTVLPTLREFLGYEDPKTFWATGGPLAPPEPRTTTPLPRFRLRQVASTARVWDGQTLVLGAGQSRTMQKDRDANGIITTNYLYKELFFFITPRLIDPAGNPLHNDGELARRTGVPEQPRKQPVNEYE
jgi:general secretion pathway protein D